MAFIELHKEKLKHNYQFLDKLFKQRKIEWGVVTKLLCGNKSYIEEVLKLGVKEVLDSRISNLKVIKSMQPDVQTVYIKPPAKRAIPNVIRYADASFNTEFATIKLLSEEAGKQKKKHKIIIMIEMGDLREGVMGEDLIDFYAKVFQLPNIEVVGIGTNLNCLYGVLPSQDKLIQLSLYKQLIDTRFDKKIQWVSGGTSVAIPLMLRNMRPMAVNHFRVGETLFFGNNLFDNKPIKGMKQDVLKLYAEIIELAEKPNVPVGYLGENMAGKSFEFSEKDFGASSYRAILDLGLLDISPAYLIPEDENVSITEASSDMLIVDLGKKTSDYKVGDLVSFKLKYMGALTLLSSSYIDKKVV